MRIESVKLEVPSTAVTNADVIAAIREHSRSVFEGDLERTLEIVAHALDATGIRRRFWMRRDSPLELACRAARRAMEEAGVAPRDVDLLIYCGIGRGFLEPSEASFVADALEMDDVPCFDVVDACMAWTRACEIAESYFESGRARRALLVNAESAYVDGGMAYPSNFTLRSVKQVEHCFAAFCGGDAAAATLLSAGGAPWERHWASTKRGVTDLCTIPLPGWERRTSPSRLVGLNGLGVYTAFASKIVTASHRHMVEILRRLGPRLGEVSMIMIHTGGEPSICARMAEECGVAAKVRTLFPEYGNIASASIPASVAVHAARGELRRGDTVAAWIASSGLSFSSYAFTY